MKITYQNGNGAVKKIAILPLTGTSSEELAKHNSKTFEISLAPGTAGATTFKQNFCILTGNEDLRTKIQWTKDIQDVLTGTHTTTLDPGKAVVKALTTHQTHGEF